MDFQSAYSVSFRGSDVECKDVSLAQQQFKDDVDINVLLERFKVTGQLPEGIRLPSYGDFTRVSDFRTAAEALRLAKDAFMDVPASIRARFENDPQKFLEFCSDKDNLPELRRLGLAPEVLGDGAKPHVAPAGGRNVRLGRRTIGLVCGLGDGFEVGWCRPFFLIAVRVFVPLTPLSCLVKLYLFFLSAFLVL